jgi:hypothetical protein
MKTYFARLTFFVLSTFFVASCVSSTHIVSSWENDSVNKKYSKVLVSAFVQDDRMKRMLEDEMVAMLEKKGVMAEPAYSAISTNFTAGQLEDKEAMMNRIEEKGYEAIATVAIVDEETETRYVPGNAAYSPGMAYPHYNNFWGYYTTTYPTLYNPGYYTTDKLYFIETNLYDTSSDKLVWSAQSKTINPADMEAFATEYAEVTVAAIKKDRFL